MSGNPVIPPVKRTYTVLGILALLGAVTSLGFFSGCETETKPNTVETASLSTQPTLSSGYIH